MSKKHGKVGNHRMNGDPARFEALADYIGQHYVDSVRRVADVAGGQGMLSRILRKKYNLDCDVIDPRGNTIVGVNSRPVKYTAEMADFYDLIIGLHPDQALREVVHSASVRPVVVIPCCNFWSVTERLGREALLAEITTVLSRRKIPWKKVTFKFDGPMNVGVVTSLRNSPGLQLTA